MKNPSFEEATIDWRSGEGDVTRVPNGRSGSALRVCKTVTGGDYQLSLTPSELEGLPAGSGLALEIWVRGDANTTHPLEALIIQRDGSGSEVAFSPAAEAVLSSSWALLQTSLTLVPTDAAKGPSTVKLRLVATGAADGACFLVDDVCVKRTP